MRRAALTVFSRCGIDAYCDTVAPYIVNRAQTGPCPMEQAVAQVETPEQAVPVLREALAARMRETP